MSYGPVTWPAGTVAQLVRVPWDNAYRDAISWSERDRTAWFNKQSGDSVTLDKVSYLAYGQQISLPLHIDVVNRYNYIRVANDFHGEYREYFYFIIGAEYVNPTMTRVQVQIDVPTTWLDKVEFTRCFVERGHVGVADSRSTTTRSGNYGQALLNLQEGLDTGTHLPIVGQEFANLGAGSDTNHAAPPLMVVSTIDLTADPGTAVDPKIQMSNGNSLELGGDAGSVYFFSSTSLFSNLLTHFQDKPHVLQGIISVTAIPPLLYERIVALYRLNEVTVGNQTFYRAAGATGERMHMDIIVNANFRDNFDIPHRYRHLHKFRTFPYATVELTNFTGQSIMIEPDRVWSDDLRIEMLMSLRPSEPRLVFYPREYGAASNTKMGDTENQIDSGEFTNHAVTTDNLPRFSVLNNNGMMYMLNNARSIQHQRNTASWAQSKNLTGADLAYNQASKAITTANRQTDSSITAMDQSRNLSNTTLAANTGIGATSNLLSGDIGGAIGSALNYAVQKNVNDTTFNINSAQARRSTNISNQQTAYNRDTNREYAEFAATGDYQNTIAGINATIQDSQMTPPGVLGATGGDALAAWYNIQGVAVRYRQITRSAMMVIGEYWLRFGYFVQSFITPPRDLHTMSKFTYWKMRDAYVRSTGAPEDAVATIRGIFESGVTVWRNPDDIGRVDMGDNEPTPGNYIEAL